MVESPSRPSARRITCVDAVRPDGVLGPVEVRGTLIDEISASDGRPPVRRRDTVQAKIDFLAGATITAIGSSPDLPGLSVLVGQAATKGFRRRLHDCMRTTAENNGVMALLEDLPNATMLSRVLLVLAPEAEGLPARRREPHIDICAGWIAGGELSLRPEGSLPPTRPLQLRSRAEEDAWASLPCLPSCSFRRHRVTEIHPNPDDPSTVSILSWFYDVVLPEEGSLLVLHNYRVRASVGADGHRLRSCEAEPGPLPTADCPAAAPSAARLVGLPLEGIYAEVRRNFNGTSTCTHLNEQLRALSDVPFLLDAGA